MLNTDLALRLCKFKTLFVCIKALLHTSSVKLYINT